MPSGKQRPPQIAAGLQYDYVELCSRWGELYRAITVRQSDYIKLCLNFINVASSNQGTRYTIAPQPTDDQLRYS
jgi:hypothetical protein